MAGWVILEPMPCLASKKGTGLNARTPQRGDLVILCCDGHFNPTANGQRTTFNRLMKHVYPYVITIPLSTGHEGSQSPNLSLLKHIFWTNVWDRQTPDNWQSINLLRFITLCWVFLSFIAHLYMPYFLGNTQKLSDSCYTLTSLQKWNAYTKHCLKLVAFTKIKQY